MNWSAVIEDRANEGVIKGKEYLSIATRNGVCVVFEPIQGMEAFGFYLFDVW